MADILPWVYFNETVLQFVEDLKVIFPNDPILLLAYSTLKVYVASKKQVLQQMFTKTMSAYEKQILARDEIFFLEHSTSEYKQACQRLKQEPGFADDLSKLKVKFGGKTSVFDTVVETLKGKWKDMSEHNKDVIWRYMIQLVKLDEVCNKSSV